MYGEAYLKAWTDDMHEVMKRIQKRLGGQRYRIVCEIFEDAVKEQQKNGLLEGYKVWIAYLLSEYYDPMYDYQI